VNKDLKEIKADMMERKDLDVEEKETDRRLRLHVPARIEGFASNFERGGLTAPQLLEGGLRQRHALLPKLPGPLSFAALGHL